MNSNLRWLPASLARLTLAIVLTATAVAPRAVRADELKDARTALQGGRLDDAQKLFEKAASQGYADGRAGVGLVWLKRHNLAKAMEAFELAQKMDGNLAMGWYGQGEVLRQQDKYAEALPKLQKAVELDRRFPEAQLALGDVLVNLKKQNDAITALTPGLNWGAQWKPRFLIALGDVELSRDSLRDAGVYYTQAREAAPNDAAPRRALGNFYLHRGIPGLAITELQAAVDMDTSDIESRQALGTALYRDARYNDALEQFKQVVAKDPEFAPGQLAIGNLYYQAGAADRKRYTDARAPLEKYTQMKPLDPRGWSVLGRDYYFLKMNPEAIAAMQKAADMGESSKDMYTVLGRAYVDAKDYPKALAAYTRGEPNTTDMLKIGQMYRITGNTAKADSLYGAMIERDSTSSDAKFAMTEMAKMRFAQKDYPAAMTLLQRRIALDPNSDEAYYYLGLSYKELKQYPEAVAALRQAVTLAPGKADRQFWLGLVLGQVDSLAGSREALMRSVAIDSTSKTAAIAFQQLGYRALLDKDYPPAIDFLERSVAINAEDIQSLIWLGQAYQNSGNRSKAIEIYNRVLAKDPNQPDAQKGKKSLEGR